MPILKNRMFNSLSYVIQCTKKVLYISVLSLTGYYANATDQTQRLLTDHPITKFLPDPQTCKPMVVRPALPKEMNIMHLDLDYAYDPNPEQMQKNIQAMIQRINMIQPNVIFLQAFEDDDGNGSASFVYFKTRHVPLRADIFSLVVQQIKSKTKVQFIFAWLPLMAWDISPQLHYIQHASGGAVGYRRLSPFYPENLAIIADIYTDFAKNNPVDGIIFHDDITLNDYEDSQPEALKYYQKWGYSKKYITQPSQPNQMAFAQAKTQYLDQLAYGATQIVKCVQPEIYTARNSYAPITIDSQSTQWMAQSVQSTLKYYDFNSIMAMPYMEQAKNHNQFYRQLIKGAKKYDPQLTRTIFELQAVNWRNDRPILGEKMRNRMLFLRQEGVQHLGYYPDNYIAGWPTANMVQQGFKIKK